MSTRRDFVRSAALASAASLAASVPAAAAPLDESEARALLREPLAPPLGHPDEAARDEGYWRKVAARYRVLGGTTNLEAGYFGMMATPVLEAYHRHIDRANRASSYFARREYPALFAGARDRVAAALGAQPSEVALSRGATEALQALIGQYNGVKAGETVLYADLDYNAMQWAMNALAQRTGATVARFDIPEPATYDNVIAAYAAALDANPRTKLLLLTHCNNKTGLVIPVKEITALAHARGVDVVVDAAHSFGQIPVSLADLGADFVGINLHKWIGAPVGAGALYIRQGKLDRIDRAHADESAPITSINSRIHTGTTHFAIVMTIPDALDFHASIGIEAKSARLRFLRDRWAIPARQVAGVDILTPDDPRMVGSLTAFRLKGRGDREFNQGIARTLLDDFGIFTFPRTGLAKGDCVRVTPALYNAPADADRLVAALRVIAAR
ncbi:MAG: aminotransferase class V-fold PLP-dependent enzyme [Gemmatimonadetes bacterium]|nr:aminotransferase class V-fold PLP-dependent enzyme [Gemmatimonadota bacterium]MBK9976956.1 aminotransferase class V-fold PLP-dependent enzyme [Gemmatimonadota bacterium]